MQSVQLFNLTSFMCLTKRELFSEAKMLIYSGNPSFSANKSKPIFEEQASCQNIFTLHLTIHFSDIEAHV